MWPPCINVISLDHLQRSYGIRYFEYPDLINEETEAWEEEVVEVGHSSPGVPETEPGQLTTMCSWCENIYVLKGGSSRDSGCQTRKISSYVRARRIVFCITCLPTAVWQPKMKFSGIQNSIARLFSKERRRGPSEVKEGLGNISFFHGGLQTGVSDHLPLSPKHDTTFSIQKTSRYTPCNWGVKCVFNKIEYEIQS